MTFLEVSLEEVGKKTREDPTQFMLDNFYDEDYKITSFGVHFMLQKLGIFRS